MTQEKLGDLVLNKQQQIIGHVVAESADDFTVKWEGDAVPNWLAAAGARLRVPRGTCWVYARPTAPHGDLAVHATLQLSKALAGDLDPSIYVLRIDVVPGPRSQVEPGFSAVEQQIWATSFSAARAQRRPTQDAVRIADDEIRELRRYHQHISVGKGLTTDPS